MSELEVVAKKLENDVIDFCDELEVYMKALKSYKK